MALGAPRAVIVTAVLAVVVIAAALVTVSVLRAQRDAAGQPRGASPPPTTTTDAASICGGNRPCEVLTSLPVGLTTVELLADENGRNGRLRIFGGGTTAVIETALAGMGVRVSQKSLICMKGGTSACLVRGSQYGGVVGEVFVARGKSWQPAERRYFSSARYVDLLQVAGDASPEVAVAEQPGCDASAEDCVGEPVVVQVYRLSGESAGCTVPYAVVTQLPGWPDVELNAADLQPCA